MFVFVAISMFVSGTCLVVFSFECDTRMQVLLIMLVGVFLFSYLMGNVSHMSLEHTL